MTYQSRLRLKKLSALISVVGVMLFFQNCSNRMMSKGEVLSQIPVSAEDLFEGQKLYATNCQTCHGEINASAKRNRSSGQIRSAMTSVSTMNTLNLSEASLRKISAALKSSFAGQPRMCDQADDVGHVGLQRLNKRELSNTIRDLFNYPISTSTNFAIALPDDNVGETFDNDAKALFMSSVWMEKWLIASETIVEDTLAIVARKSSLYICAQGTEVCASQILASFASRAYRRPVTSTEATKLLNIYKAVRNRGGNFDEAVETGLIAVVNSPQFLFRSIEHPNHSDSNRVSALNSYDLATRISYFLWSSMPDATLTAAAAANSLNTPAEIKTQIHRMLSDSRALGMAKIMADFWLEMRKFRKVSPSTTVFPSFNDALRADMDTETRKLLEDIIREDLPLSALLTSDYSNINSRLATHYGVAGFTSSGPAEFKKFNMMNSGRQGILGHASVLTMTSHTNETSIVHRGKFILKNLLCDMPPPPPNNLPSLAGSESAKANLRLTNPTCFGCHSQMDPIGGGLQNFNGIGKFRTVDEAGVSIQPTGYLPDGRRFTGVEQLLGILKVDDRAKMCATGQVMSLALGRSLNIGDDCTIARIGIRDGGFDQSFSQLVEQIVLSDQFRNQKGEAP